MKVVLQDFPISKITRSRNLWHYENTQLMIDLRKHFSWACRFSPFVSQDSHNFLSKLSFFFFLNHVFYFCSQTLDRFVDIRQPGDSLCVTAQGFFCLFVLCCFFNISFVHLSHILIGSILKFSAVREDTLSPDWYWVAVIRGLQQVNTSLVFCCWQHVKGGTASDSNITRCVHNMMQTNRKEM